MFHLVTATALWGRPAVAEAVLAQLRSLEVEGVMVSHLAVRSPEDPDPPAEVEGVEYVEAENAPLSDKWNALGDRLESLAPDVVMQVDSDSLISEGYVAAAVRAIERGSLFVYAREIGFVDLETGDAMRARTTRPGPGRTLSVEALDRIGWQLLEPGLGMGLNKSMDRRLRASGILPNREAVIDPAPGVSIVELKGSGVDMWPYSFYKRMRVGEASSVDLLEPFPAAREVLDLVPA